MEFLRNFFYSYIPSITIARSRITTTAADLLENEGLRILSDTPLTASEICDVIRGVQSSYVIDEEQGTENRGLSEVQMKNLRDTLASDKNYSDPGYMSNFSGVFVHTRTEGICEVIFQENERRERREEKNKVKKKLSVMVDD